MISAMIEEIEYVIMDLARKHQEAGITVDRVAQVYGNSDWRQYRELVREAARSLAKRNLIRLGGNGAMCCLVDR